MKIVYSRDFVKAAGGTPKPIQQKLAILLEILERNPFDEKLHTKPLMGKLKNFYSFRITRDWRVIFNFVNSNGVFLVNIAHRKDIYK